MKTKLLNNIEAKLTGDVKYISSPFESVSFNQIPDENMTIYVGKGIGYEVGVRLGAVEYIDQDIINEPGMQDIVLNAAKKRIGRGIADHVYGDIRSRLIELSIQMHHENYSYNSKSLQIVEELIEAVTYG
jgi:hypothetical protein